MRRSSFAVSIAVLLSASASTAIPAQAATPPVPYSIQEFAPKPGPGVGEIALTWKHDNPKYTTGYVLQTGLKSFDKTTKPVIPVTRGGKIFAISKSLRTYTLSAAQVASANAPVGSGNHLYMRLMAINKDSSGATSIRYYPYNRAVLPRPQAPDSSSEPMRIASFNVRTARALTDKQTWLQRAPAVAKQIKDYNPGVVAIQELGPGRADGQTGTTQGTPRQTDSLLTELNKIYAEKYDLVRTTPYVSPGTPSATQGMRILYDNTRYSLLSSCPEKTGTSSYSASCSFKLPIRPTGDTEDADRRRAAYAKLQDKSSGDKFWFVSVHFDARHSTNLTTEKTYHDLRTAQANEVAQQLDVLNTENLPVIVGGDFNTWQTNAVGNGAHDTLVNKGYYDASAAVVRKNFQYKTINDFVLTMTPGSYGIGVRIDMLMFKGSPGSAYFENVMEVTDSTRPSDHNMILADIGPFNSLGPVTVRSTSRR